MLKRLINRWRYGPSLVVQQEPGASLVNHGELRRGYPRTTVSLKDDSELYLAQNVIINKDSDIVVTRGARLAIGVNSYINVDAFIRCAKGISIGTDCLIGRSVEIRDTDGHGYVEDSQITIDDRVWIGDQVIILNGSVIGSDSIIGAGAVVPGGKYPPNSLIVGNPAVVKKSGIRLDRDDPAPGKLLPFVTPAEATVTNSDVAQAS